MTENFATPPVASEDGASLSSDRSPTTKEVEPHVRIPVELLGAVLDHGKISIAGAHLLAIKAAQPAGWTLNQVYCSKLGISSRSFKAGVRLLRASIGLVRSQPSGRKGYAIENNPIGKVRRNYVKLQRRALSLDSKIIAYGLAVILSPKPCTSAAAAQRIGIRSPKTAAKVAKHARDAGIIEIFQGVRAEILVGRPGTIFTGIHDLGKNDTAKNDLAKNGPTQVSCKSSANCKTPTKLKESSRASSSSLANVVASVEDDDAAARRSGIRFDEIVLPDWRAGEFKFPELPAGSGFSYGQAMGREQFEAWIAASGGLPPHLRSLAAYRQMDEIAAMLIGSTYSGRLLGLDRDGYSCVRGFDAMIGIIRAVCAEDAALAKKGRTLKTLHFVARRLLKQSAKFDFTWALNRPAIGRYTKQAIDEAASICSDAYRELSKIGFPMIKDGMFSTLSIEEMADLLSKHGRRSVVGAFNEFISRHDIKTTIGEGRKISGFSWFDDIVSGYAERARNLAIAKRDEDLRQAAGRRAARKTRKKPANEISF